MSPFPEQLNRAFRQQQPLLAVLLDPDKFDPNTQQLPAHQHLPPDQLLWLVGGSSPAHWPMDHWITALKKQTEAPVVSFPGDVRQLSAQADALLMLQLWSGNNPEYLTGQHIKAVPFLEKTKLPFLQTAYLLLDGGTHTATAQLTHTQPLPMDAEQVSACAKAAYYMGAQSIYLEAGSGALQPVTPELVQAVASRCPVPIWVGGGIREAHTAQALWQAGATVVVVGNALETQPDALLQWRLPQPVNSVSHDALGIHR